MKIVTVPSELEESSFEQLVKQLGPGDGDAAERRLFDGRRLRWVDPYGMLGLLAAGEVAGRGGERPIFQLPDSPEVGSYLARMGFMAQAERIFELHGVPRREREGASDVLLEITPVHSHDDVHAVVERVQGAARNILTKHLDFPPVAVAQFSIMLSEVCQNILEHANAPGWVAAQTYNWARRLGRKVAVIAVMDLGVGFKGSLASAQAARWGEKWGDSAALEAAFLHGITRFPDPGRGQGLQQIRKQVNRMGGKISIRSGTAEIADVPDWDDAAPLQTGLTAFPGAQICIVLPARAGADAPGAAGSTPQARREPKRRG